MCGWPENIAAESPEGSESLPMQSDKRMNNNDGMRKLAWDIY
jgi:hypothetical protein